MTSTEFGSFRHLAVRFFGALRPGGPNYADEVWAVSKLLPGEQQLWDRMSGPDRRHAIGVARDTATLLGEPNPDRDVSAAALLHDVGKVEASLGTFARVGVTLAALAAGRAKLAGWADAEADDGRGWRSRVGRYLIHDRIGADLLRAAGSGPLTIAWTEEHHRPPETWTVDRRVAQALKDADGD